MDERARDKVTWEPKWAHREALASAADALIRVAWSAAFRAGVEFGEMSELFFPISPCRLRVVEDIGDLVDNSALALLLEPPSSSELKNLVPVHELCDIQVAACSPLC